MFKQQSTPLSHKLFFNATATKFEMATQIPGGASPGGGPPGGSKRFVAVSPSPKWQKKARKLCSDAEEHVACNPADQLTHVPLHPQDMEELIQRVNRLTTWWFPRASVSSKRRRKQADDPGDPPCLCDVERGSQL